MRVVKILFLLSVFLFTISPVFSQEKTVVDKFLGKIDLSVYADTYYGTNTDKTSPLRKFDGMDIVRNQFRLNIARLSLQYNDLWARGNVTLQYGDIPDYLWDTKMPNIQEANIGFRPFKNFWIDAGYFQSHLGAEGLLKDNFLNSYSLPAYYEPLYQSGVKVSYNFSDEFGAAVHFINGFNLIEDNNQDKSAGLELNFSPNEIFEFTYSNILGNEMPAEKDTRFSVLNNLAVNFTSPSGMFEALAGIDLGLREKSLLSDTTKTAFSYGALLSVRYNMSEHFSATIRGDYYQDLGGIYSGIQPNGTGVKGNGLTLGFEYRPVKNGYIRLESRYLRLDNAQKVFYDNTNERGDVTMSMGFTY
ncbi:MAG: porin [Ignavibacteria bacterium]|nr:porin [Ignavibacteria bacterium]